VVSFTPLFALLVQKELPVPIGKKKGWAPKASLNDVAKRKILSPAEN
jgi:hypothetical protein